MKLKSDIFLYGIFAVWLIPLTISAQDRLVLKNQELNIVWEKSADGYVLRRIAVGDGNQTVELKEPLGEYTILYAAEKPDKRPLLEKVDEKAASFPDSMYGHIFNRWKTSLSAVPLHLAGEEIHFYPSKVAKNGKNKLTFLEETEKIKLSARWSFHPTYQYDVMVEMVLTAKEDGYFSIASPTLVNIPTGELDWGMIPGQFQGRSIENNLIKAYGYGQGVPNQPVMLRERSTSTLSPLISNKSGLTLAVIPEPGYGRDPWKENKMTHDDWELGLSLITRNHQLSPTIYHPVLGERGSYMKKGETKTFQFRYTLQKADWYEVYKHAINDIYRFGDVLTLKDTKQSLINRVLSMSHYLRDDSISMWNIQPYKQLEIGAQDYLSSVYEADGDAMKNSDYGAMWMLATIMDDRVLKERRLPYARNFKIAQQQETDGFFQGAALGQYYLWRTKRFVEEWGDYVEPIALTYYVMLDIGNMLLFDPKDEELREKLRLGADKLLKWQSADGQWQVAYDRSSKAPVFSDLKDLRPTFYGLLVAHRILGDEKYLAAARRGADWFIEHAVNEGAFLGVCGDFRFVQDFATGQSVQGLLDLYEVTKDEKYKEAAMKTARMYTASVYTHPIPTREKKEVKGVIREDWEISQVGSRFEQGGLLGSANKNGPILMASHAGMFVRLFKLTQDSLYLNMARAAAWGQDAFVDQKTNVASYYWDKMNAGVGRYPHHAWWQVGWIMDYLLAEVELRSNGNISFPRGFITPKVGPHQTYGFSAGKVYGNDAELFLKEDILSIDNERIDFIGAVNKSKRETYLILLNNSVDKQEVNAKINHSILFGGNEMINKIEILDKEGQVVDKILTEGSKTLKIPAYGLNTLKITYDAKNNEKRTQADLKLIDE